MVVENKNFIINLILLKEKHSNIIKKQKETILRVIKILKKFIYFYFLNKMFKRKFLNLFNAS